MINTLLSKITGFFEKDFLFASFLPALIFVTALVVTLAGVISIEAIWVWVETWTTMQKATAAVAATFFVVVVAYVLQALRPSFTRGWMGDSQSLFLWGFQNLGVVIQKRRYERRREYSWRLSMWQNVLDTFDVDLRAVWSNAINPAPNGRDHLPPPQKLELQRRVESLHASMTVAQIREQLNEIIAAHRVYAGNDLGDIYRVIKTKLTDWNANENARIQTDTYTLDRWFGRLQTVKGTTLGNVIEAYNYYTFKRYKIEPDIFWPRLRKVMTPQYLALVQESRILMDFLLTMATLSALYALLALIIGPWLWFNFWLWILLAFASTLLSFFFYKLSIGAAFEHGEMVRSSFDLFRLDLMTALRRPPPASLSVEQEQWEELSALATYGFSEDFALLAPPPAPAE